VGRVSSTMQKPRRGDTASRMSNTLSIAWILPPLPGLSLYSKPPNPRLPPWASDVSPRPRLRTPCRFGHGPSFFGCVTASATPSVPRPLGSGRFTCPDSRDLPWTQNGRGARSLTVAVRIGPPILSQTQFFRSRRFGAHRTTLHKPRCENERPASHFPRVMAEADFGTGGRVSGKEHAALPPSPGRLPSNSGARSLNEEAW